MRKPNYYSLDFKVPRKKIEKRLDPNLIKILPENGRLYRLNTNLSKPFGHFFYFGKKKKYFIKILPKNSGTDVEKSEKVVSFLKKKECNVLPCQLYKSTQKLEIFIYEYIDFRYCNVNTADAKKLGKEVGKIHFFLKKKKSKDSRLKTDDRLRKLEIFKKKILQRNLHNNFLNCIRKIKLPQEIKENRQIIHGDMNPWNILFSKKNNKPYVIDFENANWSYLNPKYDLIYILTRIVLLCKSKKMKILFFKNFINGYRSFNPKFKFNNFFQDNLWILTRNLSILEKNAVKSKFDLKEYEKFYKIFKLCNENNDVIEFFNNY